MQVAFEQLYRKLQVQEGDHLQVRLHDGTLRVLTEEVTPLKECEKCRKN